VETGLVALELCLDVLFVLPRLVAWVLGAALAMFGDFSLF